jgi:hypothetical protein
MLRAHKWIAVAGLLALGACDASQPSPSPGADSDFKSQINLAPLLPAGADLVGVTVSPEGKRYVLDSAGRLYLLESASRATLVYATTTPIELTDVVALGGERFAVTAENDGFMLDVHNQSLSSYFCYLPGDIIPTDPTVVPSVSQTLRNEGVAVKERTESVAFNHQTLQLFAQPQTIRLDTGAVAGSELFTFSDGGGQPIAVRQMPITAFIAGGMVVVDGRRLLMGRGSQIYEIDEQGVGPTLLKQLQDTTIDISGLALDTDGDLLVLDRASRRLLEMY